MKTKKVIISKDLLWKALIKDIFEDFMYFFYPKKAKEIDFEKGYDFLDKELEKLYPENDPKNRRADLLVKVHLKKGGTVWLFIHIEVQGYVDKTFAKRVFQMNYRAFERLKKEVVGFAIFTDDDPTFHPKGYRYGRWDSRMLYEFKTYKLLEHDPKDYVGDKKNPFAAIMKIAWYGLKKNKLKSDEELLKLKFQLLRELLIMGHRRDKIQKVIEFIKYYLYFNKQNFYHKFDEELRLLTKGRKVMTIEEVVISERTRIAKEEGLEEGIEKGLEQGLEQGLEKGLKQGVEKGLEKAKKIGTTNMLLKGYPAETIADLLELTVQQVLDIKLELERK